MEFAFIFIVFAIMFGVITLVNKININNTHTRCDELGVRHEWVLKGFEDNTYLVCEKCKILLSGIREERDSGGNDF